MTTTTTTDKPSFVYVTYITTTAEKLWEALTQGDFTEKYWGGRRVESTWQPGAPIVYRYDEGRKTDITGEVLRCEPTTVLAGVSRGWPGILSNLKTVLETGKPMPFGNWDRATAT
ncbi:SRPBCC domain-containing protein [Nannocystis sp. RBIL2]|uniref:SRPBCC domain-containing protein n=1 Tax=Nannocystis sp. RBIL2 TaxID=2996788 RepID=UPI00226EA220|nr:SRPBCC domain-containing protein [Nannocystis sp. RBIL2]MCY1063635.1 SRPBCC domain-containing protein [Nannocystis sp. RBIL2]